MILSKNTPDHVFVTPERNAIDSCPRCHGFILNARILSDGSKDPDLRCRNQRGQSPRSDETSFSVNERWYCHRHQGQLAAEDSRAKSEGPKEDFDSTRSFKKSNSPDVAICQGEKKPLKEENSVSSEPLAEILEFYTPTRVPSGHGLLYSLPLWDQAGAIRGDSSELKPQSSLPRCLPTEIKSEVAQEEPEGIKREVRRDLGPEFRKVRAEITPRTTILEHYPEPGSVQSSPRATTTSTNKLPPSPIVRRSSVMDVSAPPGSMATIAKSPADKSRQNRGYRSLFSFLSCCLTGEESEDEKEVSETGSELAQHPQGRRVTTSTSERRTTEGCQSVKKEPYQIHSRGNIKSSNAGGVQLPTNHLHDADSGLRALLHSLPDKAPTKIRRHISDVWHDSKWIKSCDNMGYIYVYEFTGYLKSEERYSQDSAYLKLEKSADGKDGGSARARYKFLTDQRDKDSRVVKIGRSGNVAQRLGQWTSKCRHDTSRNDQFPSKASTRGPVPFIRLIEHYIHVELDEYRRCIRCKFCPHIHKELFQVASEEIRIIFMIIIKWVDWAFAQQNALALALGHPTRPPFSV